MAGWPEAVVSFDSDGEAIEMPLGALVCSVLGVTVEALVGGRSVRPFDCILRLVDDVDNRDEAVVAVAQTCLGVLGFVPYDETKPTADRFFALSHAYARQISGDADEAVPHLLEMVRANAEAAPPAPLAVPPLPIEVAIDAAVAVVAAATQVWEPPQGVFWVLGAAGSPHGVLAAWAAGGTAWHLEQVPGGVAAVSAEAAEPDEVAAEVRSLVAAWVSVAQRFLAGNPEGALCMADHLAEEWPDCGAACAAIIAGAGAMSLLWPGLPPVDEAQYVAEVAESLLGRSVAPEALGGCLSLFAYANAHQGSDDAGVARLMADRARSLGRALDVVATALVQMVGERSHTDADDVLQELLVGAELAGGGGGADGDAAADIALCREAAGMLYAAASTVAHRGDGRDRWALVETLAAGLEDLFGAETLYACACTIVGACRDGRSAGAYGALLGGEGGGCLAEVAAALAEGSGLDGGHEALCLATSTVAGVARLVETVGTLRVETALREAYGWP